MTLELLNPWMLWGLAALAVPLLIHLLTRAAQRTVLFPTLQFLRRTLARQSRLMRLRHLVLLLLRMLLLALLVAAFAKPVLRLPFQQLRKRQGRTTTLIALDTSLSMGYTGSGATPLSRAKAEAEKILQGLGEGDRANVLFVSASTRAAAAQPTRDLNLLRAEMEQVGVTQEEADFNAALERAVEELEQVADEAARQELYLVSDFQRTNWAAVRLTSAPPELSLYLVDVDGESKRNAALTRIRTRPAAPRVGDAIEVTCEVANFSPEAKELAVELEVAGKGRLHQQVLAPAFGSATALFRLRFDQVGHYRATAHLPADALAPDNSRHLVLSVSEALSVYLLTDEDPRDSNASPFYLVRALAPQRSAEAGVRVTVLNRTQALRADFANADVVLVADLYQLGRNLGRKLCEYLEQRGCVFYFLSRGQTPAHLALLDELSSAGPVAPYTVTDLLDLEGMGRGFVSWTEARFESPMLKLFRDPEQGDLSAFKFYKLRLVTEVDPRAEVLLRYEDRTVAAARQRVDEGSFVLCNFSPQPRFSDMIKHDLFPPLLHELIQGALVEGASPVDFEVAHVASVSVKGAPVSPAFTFLDPLGDRTEARWQRVGQQTAVLFESTPVAGFYSVQLAGREVATASVNVCPEESDLRELNAAELAAKQQMEHKSHAVRADLEPTYVERLRHGRELWPSFLLAALCVATLEQVVAYLLRTRR